MEAKARRSTSAAEHQRISDIDSKSTGSSASTEDFAHAAGKLITGGESTCIVSTLAARPSELVRHQRTDFLATLIRSAA
ncbi:unnamed protein product [Linum trigynum]|uniref:Uncharacterized protein n=1 Tax=Linum trigynum TaxID=586398 RepID=A0AAV2F3W4_9ROSI